MSASCRSPQAVLAALVAGVLLLSGCGSGDATHEQVENKVTDLLVDDPDQDVTEVEARAVARCIADTMFDGSSFSKEERNAVVRSTDGDDLDPALVTKVADLVEECRDNPTPTGEPSDDDSDGTTTTEG